MTEYIEHDVWQVDMTGQIEVESPTQQEAITRARELFVAGKGTVDFKATLHKVQIEKPPAP